MKRITTLLAGAILLLNIALAKPVSPSQAKAVGQSFLARRTQSPALRSVMDLQLVHTANSSGNQTNAAGKGPNSAYYYVFNLADQGFVIVAGDDAVMPILGYSDQHGFKTQGMPANVAKWLEGYKQQISYTVANKAIPSPAVTQAWQALTSTQNALSSAKTTAVNPLCQTEWSQSPYVNAQCPGGSVTGCVATAMAQVMKFWEHPATGSGFHSYNHPNYGTLSANFGSTTYGWGSMPNTVNSSNNAVATLMYHCGVSVDMNYSPSSSGAYVINSLSPVTNCAEYALETYFGYSSALSGVARTNYSDNQWLNLVKAELNAGRPIVYAGFGSGGGHCFVADGYDNNDFVHFNWGWGGAYDGYFHIDALDPGGVGTGGGSGGYNSGHQAVIGIQPPGGGSPTYGMALYDYLTPSASTIYYGQSFTVSTNVVNNGTGAFAGDYGVAAFDNGGTFVDWVEIKTGWSLQAGNVYTNNLVFSTTGLFSMLPGNYLIGFYYRPNGGNWVRVANNGSYVNPVQLTVINPNDMELNSAITVTPGTTLTESQAISVSVNVINDGSTTFVGDYSLDLYNLDGSWVQEIGVLSESTGLPPGYTYIAPYLVFNNTVTVTPGTYLLALQHNDGSGWELSGSTNHANPIEVTVVSASLQADMYEVNNQVGQSYQLSASFLGNTANTNTTGSNCHITTDNDFYKVVLPFGYDYIIHARLHDAYNSGNSNTYSLDALFSYSTDGSSWSDTYDDVMPNTINIAGGGTVYFHCAPYFAGEVGSYLLDLEVTRGAMATVPAPETEAEVRIYPNPAQDFVTVDLLQLHGKLWVTQIGAYNLHGQKVFEVDNLGGRSQFDLSVQNLPDGVYFLKMKTNRGLVSKKIIVRK